MYNLAQIVDFLGGTVRNIVSIVVDSVQQKIVWFSSIPQSFGETYSFCSGVSLWRLEGQQVVSDRGG